MKFEISHVTWDVEDEMEENGFSSSDEAVESLELPTDDFEIEIDYELENPENGPTEDEMMEIEELLSDKISDEYGFCTVDFSWGLIE